jgi:Flp pilus assembly protein TadD
VIEGGVSWRLVRGSQIWPLTLTHLDPDHDLCQLKAKDLVARPLQVRTSATLAVGERVFALGAPEGLELTMSEGLVSGLRDYENGHLIQTSAPISPGSSGGGLFDAQGRLVGITTFFLKEGQNLNFALPGEWLQALTSYPVLPSENNKIASPAFQALSLYQLGNQMLDAGEYEKAIPTFREVIRLKPDSAEAWNELGIAYDRLHQYDKSIAAFEEAIRLKPDYAIAWYDLGSSYEGLHQYDKELHAYEESIRLKPDFAEVWSNLGGVYDRLHQSDKAISAFQEAIRLKPGLAQAWNELGVTYAGLHQSDKSISAFEEAIRLKPDYAIAWFNLGFPYKELGNRSKVIQIYETLKTLDPNLADKFFRKIVLP